MEFRNQSVAGHSLAFLLITFALMEGGRSVAQTQATNQAAASSRSVLLKEGTAVTLKFHDRLTSKTAVEGDLVNFVLDSDLKVGEITVAAAGSVAVGTVSRPAQAGKLRQTPPLRLAPT